MTDREHQVMEQIIRGKPVKEIAAELGISHKTVYSFRDRIFQKLNVDSDVGLGFIGYSAWTVDIGFRSNCF